MDLDIIYDMYFKDVFLYVLSLSKNKEIAEDITGETFLKALKNLDKFDGKKDIRAWLFTIAKTLSSFMLNVKTFTLLTSLMKT